MAEISRRYCSMRATSSGCSVCSPAQTITTACRATAAWSAPRRGASLAVVHVMAVEEEMSASWFWMKSTRSLRGRRDDRLTPAPRASPCPRWPWAAGAVPAGAGAAAPGPCCRRWEQMPCRTMLCGSCIFCRFLSLAVVSRMCCDSSLTVASCAGRFSAGLVGFFGGELASSLSIGGEYLSSSSTNESSLLTNESPLSSLSVGCFDRKSFSSPPSGDSPASLFSTLSGTNKLFLRGGGGNA